MFPPLFRGWPSQGWEPSWWWSAAGAGHRRARPEHWPRSRLGCRWQLSIYINVISDSLLTKTMTQFCTFAHQVFWNYDTFFKLGIGNSAMHDFYFDQPGIIAAAAAGLEALIVVVPAGGRLRRQEELLGDVLEDGEVGAGGELAQLEALPLRVHRHLLGQLLGEGVLVSILLPAATLTLAESCCFCCKKKKFPEIHQH